MTEVPERSSDARSGVGASVRPDGGVSLRYEGVVMGHFTPPPNWPSPPPGWEPDKKWFPPLDWPPIPEGWQLFEGEGLERWQLNLQRVAERRRRDVVYDSRFTGPERKAASQADDAGLDVTTAVAVYAGQVKYNDKYMTGILALFPDRVERRIVGKYLGIQYDAEVMPIASINSVQVSTGGIMSLPELNLYGSGKSLSMKMIGAEQFRQKVLAVCDQARTAPAMPTPSPQAAPPASIADELRKLASLRDEGIISASDFEQAKARLLAGG